MLELFTGSDRYDCVAVRRAGELTELGCSVPQMQSFEGRLAKVKDDREVRLKLPTFSATAEMAALSRALGGYHIPTYKAYFDGTAIIRD